MRFILAYVFIVLTMTFLAATAQASVLNIIEVTSAKGIKAWLIEDRSVPVLSLRFTFRGTGSVNDPAELQGLAQLLSNTLDEGAGEIDSKAFQEALDDRSISLSFYAGRDDFGGSLTTLSKYQDKAFDLLHDALTSPRFDSDAVARMKEANLSRIRSQMADPAWMSARLMHAVVFEGHPYAQNSGGTLSSLSRLTPDHLRKKFQTELSRDRLMVTAVGPVDASGLAQILDRIFGDMPGTSPQKKTSMHPISAATAPATLYRKDIPQTFINIVLQGIDRTDPDYAAAQVMDFILGSSGFGSRLTEVVREQRGLTYGIYSRLSDMDYADMFVISTSTRNESFQEVMTLTRSVMEDMAQKLVQDAEIKDAKNYLIGSVPLAMTSTGDIADVMLDIMRADLPRDYLDKREAAIRNVTAEDVRRVAKRLLNQDKMHIILVGQPADTDAISLRIVNALPDVE